MFHEGSALQDIPEAPTPLQAPLGKHRGLGLSGVLSGSAFEALFWMQRMESLLGPAGTPGCMTLAVLPRDKVMTKPTATGAPALCPPLPRPPTPAATGAALPLPPCPSCLMGIREQVTGGDLSSLLGPGAMPFPTLQSAHVHTAQASAPTQPCFRDSRHVPASWGDFGTNQGHPGNVV